MNLLNTIKRELDALDIKPKKSLGQNFLVNEGIYKKIVAALEIKNDDTIIEIGSGLGTLTGFLAESGARVIAVEKDHQLAEYLRRKFANQKNAKLQLQVKKSVTDKRAEEFAVGAESRTKGASNGFGLSPFGARVRIIEDDILKFSPVSCELEAGNYKLAGNIPFYLTSHLIRTVFEKWPRPEKIVLMLQKEVAQRIVAKPPKMSLLTVSVQYYAEPEIISYVSAGSFYPVPEVDSAIVKLETSDKKQVTKTETENFFKIVRVGFAGKRKQLINNLAAGLKLPKKEIESRLATIDINPKRRAETLTIEEWQKITDIFSWRD